MVLNFVEVFALIFAVLYFRINDMRVIAVTT